MVPISLKSNRSISNKLFYFLIHQMPFVLAANDDHPGR